MVVTEEPAAVGQDLAAQLVRFGRLAAQAGQPGQGFAGGQGVGVVVAQDVPAAAEHTVDDVDGLGVAAPRPAITNARLARHG